MKRQSARIVLGGWYWLVASHSPEPVPVKVEATTIGHGASVATAWSVFGMFGHSGPSGRRADCGEVKIGSRIGDIQPLGRHYDTGAPTTFRLVARLRPPKV